MLALLWLSDARSVATEAFRTADFVMAVQMVMCDSDRSIPVYHHVYGPSACDSHASSPDQWQRDR